MNIRCGSCSKTFEVIESLIPSKGRLVKCGSCGYEWFFKPILHELENTLENDLNDKIQSNEEINQLHNEETQDRNINPFNEIEASESRSNSQNLSIFLKLFIVAVISFIAFLIVLDTFKGSLSNFFPNLENLLQNFYETLKDIFLFFKDLMN